MKIEIKHKVDGSILFECNAASLKLAVTLATTSYANLRDANLRYANLRYANLRYANLRDARGVPIIFTGLIYDVQIYKNDTISIGCEKHKTSEWLNFTKEEIHGMDGDDASTFWDEYKDMILSIADKHQG